MESGTFVWVKLVMDIIEIAALGVLLWELIAMRREMEALLRVVRRIDRGLQCCSNFEWYEERLAQVRLSSDSDLVAGDLGLSGWCQYRTSRGARAVLLSARSFHSHLASGAWGPFTFWLQFIRWSCVQVFPALDCLGR